MTPEKSIDLEAIVARIRDGKPVRRTLPGGGRLHVDRPLPFLCVYRAPSDRTDLGTSELVRPQASHLVVNDALSNGELGDLVHGVVDTLADACGACLLLEVWSGSVSDFTPHIRIHTARSDRLATTVSTLAEALRSMSLPNGALPVDVITGGDGSPPDKPRLLSPELARHSGYLLVGLEIPPVYRSEVRIYPDVLRALSAELSQALQRAFFEFARVQTPAQPSHYHAMGRHRMLQSVREADRALTKIERSFDFLLDVTPVNTEEAWEEFCASGRARAPTLRYRMLEVDPELAKRRLYDIRLDRLEDPVLARLLRDKRRELDRKLGLLEERDGPRFLPGSIQLYGGVDDELLRVAQSILVEVLPSSAGARLIDAKTFAARARAEIARYRRHHPTLGATVELRDDIPSLIVARGSLLVPRRIDMPERRVDAALQHEVGTHIVTAANGSCQPLSVLAVGLAGYEALQEGLAMFAEHMAGGLDANRLRLIAARAIAVRRLIEGTTFPDLVAELSDSYGLSLRAAFGVALRVFRGGGLTKDAIYLRGLIELLDYLAAGGAIELLLIGKIALEQVAFVEELVQRQVLRAPPLRPRWLDKPDSAARLDRARSRLRPTDLVEDGVFA